MSISKTYTNSIILPIDKNPEFDKLYCKSGIRYYNL